MIDSGYMQRAIELASGFHPHPNPRVGCVVVRDGAIVGEGAHRRDGEAHAETLALADAGDSARGADVYVTLEPCSHVGRTPSCARALVDAGVRRVVVATADPDARVSGRGIEILEAAGVDVLTGDHAHEAVGLDRPYHHHRRTGRPYVVGLLGIADAADVQAVDVLEPGDVSAQLADLGQQPVVSVGVTDRRLVDRLVDLGLLDELRSGAESDRLELPPGFVTVAGPDSIRGYTISRKAEHVHGDH